VKIRRGCWRAWDTELWRAADAINAFHDTSSVKR
jgi:hypothetical protein